MENNRPSNMYSISTVTGCESGIEEHTAIASTDGASPENVLSDIVPVIAEPITRAAKSALLSSDFQAVLHKPEPCISKRKINKRRRAANQRTRELREAFNKTFIMPYILDAEIEKLD